MEIISQQWRAFIFQAQPDFGYRYKPEVHIKSLNLYVQAIEEVKKNIYSKSKIVKDGTSNCWHT